MMRIFVIDDNNDDDDDDDDGDGYDDFVNANKPQDFVWLQISRCLCFHRRCHAHRHPGSDLIHDDRGWSKHNQKI